MFRGLGHNSDGAWSGIRKLGALPRASWVQYIHDESSDKRSHATCRKPIFTSATWPRADINVGIIRQFGAAAGNWSTEAP